MEINSISSQGFFWEEFGTDTVRNQTKRTVDFLDEACGSNCDVLYSKNFEENVDSLECVVKKFLEDKKKTKVRKLAACDFVFNPRDVIYFDNYTDTFNIGEPVINMKKVQSCELK